MFIKISGSYHLYLVLVLICRSFVNDNMSLAVFLRNVFLFFTRYEIHDFVNQYDKLEKLQKREYADNR